MYEFIMYVCMYYACVYTGIYKCVRVYILKHSELVHSIHPTVHIDCMKRRYYRKRFRLENVHVVGPKSIPVRCGLFC